MISSFMSLCVSSPLKMTPKREDLRLSLEPLCINTAEYSDGR
jgi:hypothetical protein